MEHVANSDGYDLLELHKCDDAKKPHKFCAFMQKLDVQKLIDGYDQLKSCASRRHGRDKKYFVPRHDGMPRSKNESVCREEHLAMALFNDFAQKGVVEHAEMSKLQFLDYQFPLKARLKDAEKEKQKNTGVGKVDLFGVIDGEHPCVVELKVGKESPLRALLQALAYCATVEANIKHIANENEANEERRASFAAQRPRLMILAPDAYWQYFMRHPDAGNWQPAFRKLLAEIHQCIGVRTHLASLPDDVCPLNWENSKPHLQCEKCVLKSV